MMEFDMSHSDKVLFLLEMEEREGIQKILHWISNMQLIFQEAIFLHY